MLQEFIPAVFSDYFGIGFYESSMAENRVVQYEKTSTACGMCVNKLTNHSLNGK